MQPGVQRQALTEQRRYDTGKTNTSANLETIPVAMEYYGLIRQQSQEELISRKHGLTVGLIY